MVRKRSREYEQRQRDAPFLLFAAAVATARAGASAIPSSYWLMSLTGMCSRRGFRIINYFASWMTNSYAVMQHAYSNYAIVQLRQQIP